MSPAASSQKKRKANQLDASDSNEENQVPKTRKRAPPFCKLIKLFNTL